MPDCVTSMPLKGPSLPQRRDSCVTKILDRHAIVIIIVIAIIIPMFLFAAMLFTDMLVHKVCLHHSPM